MSLGIVMLVHTGFDRAEQMVRHWIKGGCPVVIHVDSKVDAASHDHFVQSLSDLADVRFCRRYRCEWGMWGMVEATQSGVSVMLDEFPDVRHVMLASGTCLPLRPVAELLAYLDRFPDTDFIESATTADVPWTVGGLDRERFTLRFPFSWKRTRKVFDFWVWLQQSVGYRRRLPEGLVPHMGSQWWCLTRQTLESIANDRRRASYDRYFRQVWIPDESYYQSLVRLHARRIESRSLTLSKFDHQGKPHIFFDDHLELLQRSRCFVARKIWRDADVLYQTFPQASPPHLTDAEPNTGTVDRVFSQAVERRTLGRPGLFMQSRYPSVDRQNVITAAPYAVLQGFDDIFPEFQRWLGRRTGAEVHGHLFGRDRAHFAGDVPVYRGCLTDHPRLRDYNAKMFLTNLIWNGREKHHCFQFGPADSQEICWTLAKDTNASIWVVSGAWSVSLFTSGRSASEVRAEAARLQQIENKFLKILRSPEARARIQIFTLAEFIEAPMDVLQSIIDEIAGHKGKAISEAPRMAKLEGLSEFLQDLKNQGMHPFLTGDILPVAKQDTPEKPRRKPYIVAGKMSRFDYFVVLAEMRTGSNFLEANLNRLDGVTCHGEAFNPSFIGFPKSEDLLGVTYEMREEDPFDLLDRIKADEGLSGFRLFHNHDQRIAAACLADPRCAKIILTRNPVDSFVSWKIAQATGQWKLTNATHSKTRAIAFEIADFEALLDALLAFQADVKRQLQVTGQTAFYIDYDDLRDVDVVNGIPAFLGVDARLDNINKKLKKQNPDPMADKVTNFDDMQDALQSRDWFALWRTPHFEPQRGPAIPSYVAPAKTGLAYLPLRSGPDRAIKAWMRALDDAELHPKFSQRSLRDWFETRLPHRSFAVLRHPVARAHTAFCDRILSDDGGPFAEIRANLRRVHKLPIPETVPDMTGTDGYDHSAHRAAFLSFLNFLRVNLGGQTSIRVDPNWASQHVLLQGIAQFASPDVILREEDLPEALPALAADVGKTDVPAFPVTQPAQADWLETIYDTEIEQATRTAYARDYQLFGFKDWA